MIILGSKWNVVCSNSFGKDNKKCHRKYVHSIHLMFFCITTYRKRYNYKL